MINSNQLARILVVGSSNTDMVVRAHSLPRPGETILGGTFFMNPGGKGANQAVAAARLGADVVFVCKTGDDIFGKDARRLFAEERIDTSYIFSDARYPSGVALITVDEQAENCIVVASGANAHLTSADLAFIPEVIEQSEILLMQLEIPLETVEYVAEEAVKMNKRVILNPAPGQLLPDRLLKGLYCLTPNETEAELITGIKVTDGISAQKAAKVLLARGVKCVIVTLGAKGVLIMDEDGAEVIPALNVHPVDTTAAGDVFNGAFAVALAEGRTIREAATFACKASSISVTRKGAQASAPYRKDIDVLG
jgi:ribokinase